MIYLFPGSGSPQALIIYQTTCFKKYDLWYKRSCWFIDLRTPLGAVVAVKQDTIADQSRRIGKLKTFCLNLVPTRSISI
jgi:hypothetical protein